MQFTFKGNKAFDDEWAKQAALTPPFGGARGLLKRTLLVRDIVEPKPKPKPKSAPAASPRKKNTSAS